MTWLARGSVLAALALVALGISIVVRTLAAGVGGGLGLVIGGLLVAAGIARLLVGRR